MRGIALLLGLILPLTGRAVGPEASALLLQPDADGVIDLAAAQEAETFDALPNPFRLRYRPAAPVREVTLAIRAVVLPAPPGRPAALVNGRLYSPGDTLEGLSLANIQADHLELAADGVGGPGQEGVEPFRHPGEGGGRRQADDRSEPQRRRGARQPDRKQDRRQPGDDHPGQVRIQGSNRLADS